MDPRPSGGGARWAAGFVAALTGFIFSSAGCTGVGGPFGGPVAFDTVRAWMHGVEGDSTDLLVEVAATEAQQTRGLAGRSELDTDSGMLFVFEEARPDTAGFWMWGTRIPLDIAFLDRDGVVLEILSMEPCPGPEPDGCPVYTPSVEYWKALEVNRGWFARNGYGVGDRLRIADAPEG